MIYEREHEIAVTLQQSVLPGQLPEIERLDVAVRYLPGRNELEVGGDWYDVIELGRNRVGVVVGDVVGKGVIAASAMAQLRNALRVYALDGLKPSSVLSRLAELARTVGAPFATVAYMVIDTERGTCRYASAGHPPPLHLRQGWPPVYLEGGRTTPIGIGLDTRGRQASVELQPGDLLLLYTDGLVESRTMTLNEGMDRLCEAVETGPESLDGMLDYIGEQLAVDTRQDDVALVAIRWLPAPSLALRLAAEPSSLAEMRRELRTWLDVGGVEPEEANDILVACSEACANAIVHAVDPAAPEFELTGTRSNGEISVVVRDFGQLARSRPGTRQRRLRPQADGGADGRRPGVDAGGRHRGPAPAAAAPAVEQRPLRPATCSRSVRRRGRSVRTTGTGGAASGRARPWRRRGRSWRPARTSSSRARAASDAGQRHILLVARAGPFLKHGGRFAAAGERKRAMAVVTKTRPG